MNKQERHHMPWYGTPCTHPVTHIVKEAPPVSIREYGQRLKTVAAQMKQEGLDMLLVFQPENICYLSNVQTAGDPLQCLLFVSTGSGVKTSFFTRLLELSNVHAYCPYHLPTTVYREHDDPHSCLRDTVRAAALDALDALETPVVIGADRSTALASVECDFVSQLRLVKTPAELLQIETAGGYTRRAMVAGIQAVTLGATENDVAAVMTAELYRAGSEYAGYPAFVSAGTRGVNGHSTHRRHPLTGTVTLEVAGCHNRYHCALMRTVYVGPDKPAWLQEAEALVLMALDAAIAAMTAGTRACDVDCVVRGTLCLNTHEGCQLARTAYSIGIGFMPDWGEGDVMSIDPTTTKPLQANMVFHLIPWMQYPGKGAVMISETVIIQPRGPARCVIDLPREITVVA